jgi:formiminoglutamate deiminase
MLEAGFTRVGEFHYLHHDKDGGHYADIAEMAARIASAASATGIALTLLPVFYAHAGFGGTVPGEGQRRFINDRGSYAAILERCRTLTNALAAGITGVAPHSLRAVTPDELSTVVTMAVDGPIHIHIAEQVKEVEDSIAWSGRRPVEWLLDNQEVDGRWCFIHATHMTPAETRGMANAGAIAGLCPVTEANLGDGTFPAPDFLAAGGRFGVGSDSNVLIGLPEELRQLEYSQRLAHRARNVLTAPGGSTGRALFDGALAGGAAALGAQPGLVTGHSADFVSLKARHGLDLAGDVLLDGWIFANGAAVDCVWVNGRRQVEDGRHVAREAIGRRFTATMRTLAGR